MATSRALAPFWTLRKRLIKHKDFLVQIEKSGWATARKNLIRKAAVKTTLSYNNKQP